MVNMELDLESTIQKSATCSSAAAADGDDPKSLPGEVVSHNKNSSNSDKYALMMKNVVFILISIIIVVLSFAACAGYLSGYDNNNNNNGKHADDNTIVLLSPSSSFFLPDINNNNHDSNEERLLLMPSVVVSSSSSSSINDVDGNDDNLFFDSPSIGDEEALMMVQLDDNDHNNNTILESLQSMMMINDQNSMSDDDSIDDEDIFDPEDEWLMMMNDEDHNSDRPLLLDYDEIQGSGRERRRRSEQQRKLNPTYDQFHPSFPCNDDLDQDGACTKNSFRDLVEKSSNSNSNSNSDTILLVVPECQCYIVDYTEGEEIVLSSGLSINGKLYFPPEANITLRTPFVWVKGILEIDNPDVDRQVKFSLFGDEQHTYTSFNHDCPLCKSSSTGSDTDDGSGNGCNMGSKVIAVVGGRLNIKGLSSSSSSSSDTGDTCPSWEKLANIGKPTPRLFADHRPCSNDADDTTCWQDDTIQLNGPCRESPGHTQKLGKYTVYCPIKSKALIAFGEKEGIQLTSIKGPDPKFEYPKSNNGKELSLNVNGNCGKAGHTNRFKRCVIQCPLKKTEVIRYGYNTSPLTFTSVIPTDRSVFQLPSVNNEEVSLRIKGGCRESPGHTNAYKRCAVMCRLFNTVKYNGGERTGKLQFTSKFAKEPIPFPAPIDKTTKEKAKFTLSGACIYMAGHTNAWGGCVVRCPVERTQTDFGSFHAAARLNNMNTNNYVDMQRILTYAHGGIHMYLLLQDVSKDQCSSDGANTLNDIFSKGDEIIPSYQITDSDEYAGNNFDVDQILHYSYNKNIFLFLPSGPQQSDIGTCGNTATDFSSKFPSGYKVDIQYNYLPPGGETFNVDKVHHWAWNGNRMFFFPEKQAVETCDETVSEFNEKFNKNYGIDVSKRERGPGIQLGEVVNASKGVHHWSWNKHGFFFFPDESDEQINNKFPPETTLQVDYLTATDVYDIQVSPEAAKCWEAGSELLLTSHTRWAKDQQVRTIKNSNTETGILTLSKPVMKPITKADDEDFAIEVASLSRRIVFEAENDSNDDQIGGHLIVHHTKSPQHIQGVEIRNFGQQGRLGKYPIHFHKCGDSYGSAVRKNVVRNSNQRCYVVHMTNQVTFEENVAYDAFGHCYFIEDGRETENTFRKNLGSGIKKLPSDRVVQLGEQSERSESDGNPSVFWISNPNNNFYGNVAAGGDGNGYWFETHHHQRHTKLGAFVDNEVHSSRRWAFTTYSPGWRPNEVAVIKNLKAYRNPTWGAFLHVTQNLYFDGGLFADNGDKAVMISRGDDLVFDGTTFIGQTKWANKDCVIEKVAIHLDPVRLQETVLWNFAGNKKGTTIIGAKFEKWGQADTKCPSEIATPLKFFSLQTFIKSYSAPHVFEDLQFDSDYFVDALMPGSTIDDVQIEVSSDINNALLTNNEAGFFISPKLEVMVPTDCKEYNQGLMFCPGSCIRTVTVLAGNAPFFDNIDMIVRDKSEQREITIRKDVRGHPEPEPVANRFFSAYTVALPKSDYEIRFVDSSTGTLTWPRYAFIVTEAAPVSCEDYVVESDFTFTKPDPIRPVCDNLIYNGNFDEGKDGWYAFHHGIELLEADGIGGTPALGSVKALNAGNNMAESIDGSCLEVGNEYNISFSFKIISGSDNNLPYVRLESQNFDTSDPTRKRLTTIRESVYRTTSGIVDDWNTITGTWIIDETVANADKHIFHVGGGNYNVIIDNVSVQLKQTTSAPTVQPTETPTIVNSAAPTLKVSDVPSTSSVPSTSPILLYSNEPTSQPSSERSRSPTELFSLRPITASSSQPSATPTIGNSLAPTLKFSDVPNLLHSNQPSSPPSSERSGSPTELSSLRPSTASSSQPSATPTIGNSVAPTLKFSDVPNLLHSYQPSNQPSSERSGSPTELSSLRPITASSSQPSTTPTIGNSVAPTLKFSDVPNLLHSNQPSSPPSSERSGSPTELSSLRPNTASSSQPSTTPTIANSVAPTLKFSDVPNLLHSNEPSSPPSSERSGSPTGLSSFRPSTASSSQPTALPISLSPNLTYSVCMTTDGEVMDSPINMPVDAVVVTNQNGGDFVSFTVAQYWTDGAGLAVRNSADNCIVKSNTMLGATEDFEEECIEGSAGVTIIVHLDEGFDPEECNACNVDNLVGMGGDYKFCAYRVKIPCDDTISPTTLSVRRRILN